jgi:hypothetical protein
LLAALPPPDLTQAAMASAALVFQGQSARVGERDYVASTSDRNILHSVFLI